MPTTAPSQLTERTRLASTGARPGLLVSVRDVDEANAALRGGATVIDIKEPKHGPLGRADARIVEAIVATVDGAAPVTMALGELRDIDASRGVPSGIAAAKVGLAGASALDWRDRLREIQRQACGATIVPVAYAEEVRVGAPTIDRVLEAASIAGWLVIDTFQKRGASSLEVLGASRLSGLVRAASDSGVRVVLAGGLAVDQLGAAARVEPALIGVRGAACNGGRNGVVSRSRVQLAAQTLADIRSSK